MLGISVHASLLLCASIRVALVVDRVSDSLATHLIQVIGKTGHSMPLKAQQDPLKGQRQP